MCLCTYLSPACPSTHTFHWFLLPSACLLGLLALTWQEPATKTPKLGESVVEVKGLHKHVSGLLACLLACLLVCLLTCVLLRNTWLPAPPFVLDTDVEQGAAGSPRFHHKELAWFVAESFVVCFARAPSYAMTPHQWLVSVRFSLFAHRLSRTHAHTHPHTHTHTHAHKHTHTLLQKATCSSSAQHSRRWQMTLGFTSFSPFSSSLSTHRSPRCFQLRAHIRCLK